MRTHPVLSLLAAKGIRLGLERVGDFLSYLGEPHRAYPVIHVGGTNGKGSVCAYLTQALVAAGYRVGTMTSPHLEHVNERIAVQGVPIDDASLVEAIEAHDRARIDWATSRGLTELPLTYYEFVTTLGFRVFAERQVDVVVVEVGLGGRLDATNVVDPVVSAITSVGMDHTQQLGDTLALIAAEKAAIIKRNGRAVVGPLGSEALEVVTQRAAAMGATLWRPGPHLRREQRHGLWALGSPEGGIQDVRLGMRGVHQGANASVALGILHQLRQAGFWVPDEAIYKGLTEARMPGRIEQVRPSLIVDGSHNIDSTEALALWLAEQPRPATRILLWGMGRERDPRAVIAPLLPHVDEVVTTSCAHPKARNSLELARLLEDIDVVLSDGGPIDEALPEVYREADETLVAGSLYLAGAVRALSREGALDGMEPGQGPNAGD